MEVIKYTPQAIDMAPRTILEQAESYLELIQLLNKPERIGSDVVNFYPAKQPGKTLISVILEKDNKRYPFTQNITGILVDPRYPSFTILFIDRCGDLASKTVSDGEYKPYLSWQST